MEKKRFLGFILFIFLNHTSAQEADYALEENISYYTPSEKGHTSYRAERCKLDLYRPTDSVGYATIIYFHGGGLSAGEKHIPEELKNKGIAIVAPNYRLSPEVKTPTFIDDAARATAWVMKHIEGYGGDPNKIFISGHSAGGYLASIVTMDTTYLMKYGFHSDDLAGAIPFSGHTTTHFTTRQERGIAPVKIQSDIYAPIYHTRADAPPFLLITGDREMELLGRYEENAFFWRMMKVAGHPDCQLYELEGYGHLMTAPAFPLLVKYVTERSNASID